KSAYSKKELEIYDRYLNTILAAQGMMFDSEAKGRAEGEAIGRAEGEAKGKAEVVIRAAKKGYSLEDISDLTGLSLTEIDAILKREPGL
ncbi:MAG: hypothetical protein LBC98_08480, partial [Prevotellaceae bacterium]|nr:hypothetical protein [Prevotellaceae bacterium]